MQHPLMRFVIGLLSGVLGMLAGWTGLAALVIALAGPDRDGGLAMGAFFNIGPLGGLLGFAAGVLFFIKIGQIKTHQVAQVTSSAAADSSNAAPAAGQTRVSPVFAVAVLAITAGLGWWGWYELIRSPYLTHGFMTLHLQ